MFWHSVCSKLDLNNFYFLLFLKQILVVDAGSENIILTFDLDQIPQRSDESRKEVNNLAQKLQEPPDKNTTDAMFEKVRIDFYFWLTNFQSCFALTILVL